MFKVYKQTAIPQTSRKCFALNHSFVVRFFINEICTEWANSEEYTCYEFRSNIEFLILSFSNYNHHSIF